MRDPQEIYGGECRDCGNWFADDEEDLDDAMRCDDCAEEHAAEADSPPPTLARADWFSIAAGVLGPYIGEIVDDAALAGVDV